MVKEAWMDQVVDGWGTFVHKKKLKGVKMVLKKWNMEEFGMLHTKQPLNYQVDIGAS